MEYYYTKKENVYQEKNELAVDGFEYKHLVKVLRKKTGDNIIVTDGERNIYHCRIKVIDREKLLCEILNRDFNLYEPEINISLYLSPLRNSDRFEFAIEKAVELGVSSIHPVITEYTVNKSLLNNFKYDRINKIIIGAMGQSQRCLLPELYKVINFHEMLEESLDCKNKIVMYEYSEDKDEVKSEEDSNDIILLIGPEGGFSESEIKHLNNNNWQIKSLGERKLRAETAAVVSVFSIISKLNSL